MSLSKKCTLLVFSLFLVSFLVAEQLPQGDTESTVPELVSFHEVIYPIWHSAWPAKDVAALRGFQKEVDAGFAKVEKAKLPGILRDKQAAWDKGLAEFRAAVAEYDRTAGGKDDQALLAAAEVLHARFEMMVRVIRPATKEIDAFHKVLYTVFHRYLPEKQYGQIKAVAADMLAKAEAITKATLSPRLQSRTEAFQKAAAALLAENVKLAGACKAGDDTAIEKAVLAVHTVYQELEKIFD